LTLTQLADDKPLAALSVSRAIFAKLIFQKTNPVSTTEGLSAHRLWRECFLRSEAA